MSTGGGAAAGAPGASVGSNGAGLAGNGSNGDGGEATNGQQQGQAFDPGQIAQMLQGLQGGQEQLRQQFSDLMGQQPGQDADDGDYGEDDTGDLPPEVADALEQNADWTYAGEASGEELGLDGDPDGEADGFGDPNDPVAMAHTLGDAFASYIAGELAPLQQEVAEARRETQEAKLEAEYRQLASEFPDLGDRETMEEVLSVARDFATARGLPPTMAADPALLRMVYMAGVAAEIAQAEAGAEEPGMAHLEGGAGGAPSGGRVDAGDAIVNPTLAGGALGSRALPFS
jgi:hypothetical protein